MSSARPWRLPFAVLPPDEQWAPSEPVLDLKLQTSNDRIDGKPVPIHIVHGLELKYEFKVACRLRKYSDSDLIPTPCPGQKAEMGSLKCRTFQSTEFHETWKILFSIHQ